VLIVPYLVDVRASIVFATCTGLGSVVSWAAAADVRDRTILLGQSVLHITQGVCSCIAGSDTGLCEPVIGWILLVVHDGCFVELDDFLVINIIGAVARHVEGGVASSVFAKFMGPESLVGCALVDPVFIHIRQQIVLSKCFDEGVYTGASVGRNNCAIRKTVGGIRAGTGVELTAQITILGIRAVAEVGPCGSLLARALKDMNQQ
jgi:hypothetical protein